MELIPVQNAQLLALTEAFSNITEEKYELQQVFLHQKVFHIWRYCTYAGICPLRRISFCLQHVA